MVSRISWGVKLGWVISSINPSSVKECVPLLRQSVGGHDRQRFSTLEESTSINIWHNLVCLFKVKTVHQYLCSPTGPGCARRWEADRVWRTEPSPGPLSSRGYYRPPACCQTSGPGGRLCGCEGSRLHWGSEPAARRHESLRTDLWGHRQTGLLGWQWITNHCTKISFLT